MTTKPSLSNLLQKIQSLPPIISSTHPIERVLGSGGRGKKLYIDQIIDYLSHAESVRSEELNLVLDLCIYDGLDGIYGNYVCGLLDLPNQQDNDSIIEILTQVGRQEHVGAIYISALRIPDYDDARSYARKCIRALKMIGGAEAIIKLGLLADHEDVIIREHAIAALGGSEHSI